MLSDGFKKKYTTIPVATYKNLNKEIGYCRHHYHKEVELLVVVDGAMDFFLGTDFFKINAGEVLFIPPYCPHHSTAYPNTYHECIAFDLSLLWDESLRHDLEKGVLTVKSHLTKELPYTKHLYNYARRAFQVHEEKRPGWEMEVIGNLSAILGKLTAESFFVRSEKINLEESFARKTIEYINEHFREAITSTTAASELHVNNSYFCRLFKKTFRCSFTEYLIYRRIEYAKILLNTTNNLISDIALECGFNGFSYFSKSFQKITGKTPSEYRKKKQTSN